MVTDFTRFARIVGGGGAPVGGAVFQERRPATEEDYAVRQPSRLGFTLVEVLVVIAVIGILIALLLPAVQAARETARRMQCSSHLKQIALALHNYHDSHKVFPPGGITLGTAVDRPPSLTNWAICLLPYLEQEPLHDTYDQSMPNEAPENRATRESSVSIYLCPTDLDTDQLVVPAWGTPRDAGCSYARGSYRCVAGRADRHPNWWDCKQVEWPTGMNPLPNGWRGVLHHVGTGGLVCERFASLQDGSSNTLAFGERHVNSERLNRGTMWAATAVYYNMGTAVPESRTLFVNYDECVAIDPPNDNECKRGWGSYHSGGINFAACDGSVHMLSRNIDMGLFCQLASIAEHKPSALP